jgi:tetratricopeptide (TPR) repeat protein
MRMRQSILLILSLTTLIACESTNTEAIRPPVLLDPAFVDHDQYVIETPQAIFAMNKNMMAFVDETTSGLTSEKGKLTALIEAIFSRSALSLSYSAKANTSAQETFDQGSANCLSLTIMAYAMTQHLGMQSVTRDIAIPEFWTRRNGNSLINKHINLAVKTRKNNRHSISQSTMVVDFDRRQGMRIFRATELNEAQIVAYFYVNRAADHIISNEPNKAYAYLKGAIQKDSQNAGAWLNLGVLFSQHEHYKEAESYYEMALTLDPNFASAYENLAFLYKRQGKLEHSQQLLGRLHKKRQDNPYYHVMLGDIATENKQHKQAISHYKKAISLNARPHEFHFSLAKVYYAQGDMKNAQRYLRNAKRRANGSEQLEGQYAAKISALIAQR